MTGKKSLKGFESIVAFLIFEILALTSFGLGGINVVFHFAGFLVAVFAFLTSYDQFKKGELVRLLTIVVPLFVFAILVSFGGASLYKTHILENIGTFLGILGFLFMGMAARRNESFNIETALICIGGGLSLLVLINMFATWFDYGPFYPLIYASTPDGYYNGEVINLTKEMNIMIGLRFYESSIAYGSQYAVLLATSIPALFFIDRKKETRKFLIVCGFAVISVLSLITITSITSIIFLAIIIVIGVLYRFFNDNALFKTLLKWALIVIVCIAGLFIFVVVLNNLNIGFVTNTIEANAFLNRLFNTNHFIKDVNSVLSLAFKPYNLFGFQTNSILDKEFEVLGTNTNRFELEIIKEGGIFALIAIIVFMVFTFFMASRYLRNSSDKPTVKSVVLSFLIVFALYYSVCYEALPLVHYEGDLDYYLSFSRSAIFMVVLFIIGYIANAKSIAPVEYTRKEKQIVPQQNGVSAVEEYDFSDSDQEEKQ